IATIALVLMPARSWLGAQIDRVVLRRSRRRRAILQEFLHTLSPDAGATACCRSALRELVRVMQLRGAAVLLAGGEIVAEGTSDAEPIARVWPRGDAARRLPRRAFLTVEIEDAAPRDALIDADVTGGVPIATRRGRFGDLLVCAGMLATIFSEDD